MSASNEKPRVMVVRKRPGPTGRVEHDEYGQAVWVRTRATDPIELPVPELEVVGASRPDTPVQHLPYGPTPPSPKTRKSR